VSAAEVSRRRLMSGAAAAGVGAPLLAACGAGAAEEQSDQAADAPAGPTIVCRCHSSRFSGVDGSVLGGPATAALAAAEVSVSGDQLEVDGQPLGGTSEVPEGGGAVYSDQKVVVTQPEAGEFKAFTAVCTHQGCLVSSVEPA
jgi:Rieske Fe-S protein